MANYTYYVSYNGTNFSLKDSNGNAATSVSTTTNYVEKINLADTVLDSRYYTYYTENLGLGMMSDVTSTLSDGESYFQFNGDSLTVGLSLESVSHTTTYYTASVTTATSVIYSDSSPEQTFTLESDSLSTHYRLYSIDAQTYEKSTLGFTCTRGYLVSSTAGGSKITIFSYSMPLTESSVSSVYNEKYTTYSARVISTSTYNTGLLFSSTTSSNENIVYYSTNLVVTTRATSYISTYSGNPYVTSKTTSSAAWWQNVKVLRPSVTSQTSWTTVTSNYANTTSTLGLVVDEDGNVAYGTVSGLGAIVPLNNGNYRPGVITAFSKSVDVSTIDTSWFATFTTRKSASGTSSTADTYIEFNNYGIGGTISSSTYTWNIFRTITTTETPAYEAVVSIDFSTQRIWIYKTLTGANVYNASVKISDNSCPFMSSTSIYVFNSTLSVPYEIDTITSVAEEITSQETSRTRTIEFTTWNWEYTLSGYNTYLSITDTISSTTSKSISTSSTTYLEVTETTSCDVESSTDQYGYYYFTTFYGELGNNTFYATSWVNSAIVVSDVSDYTDGLTKYTVEYITSAFGNIVNSTTIVEENILSSIVYSTVSSSKTVSTLSVRSSTSSSVNVPIKYFTTMYSSFSNATEYDTYMGPGIGWNGPGLETYYDYDVTVTSIGSYVWGWNRMSSQQITSSVLNTSDYGTTYRLSELISSSSWFNVGKVNGTFNYKYSYDVNSMYSYNTLISTLSNYSTVLYTTFSVAYNTSTEVLSYSFTATQSNVVRTTGERFIDRVEIYRASTIGSYGRNTVAVFSGSTIDTVSSSITGSSITSTQDVSTVSRTFISSTADFSTDTEIVETTTNVASYGSFNYSSRELISSTTEQQNDTLIFASTFQTVSFYNNMYTTSTLNTIRDTLSATTYTDWYDPISWTVTRTSVATSTGVEETAYNATGSVVVTQSITYTPVYEDVDGVYVTA